MLGSQDFTNLIFSANFGRFDKRLRTPAPPSAVSSESETQCFSREFFNADSNTLSYGCEKTVLKQSVRQFYTTKATNKN